MKQLKHWSIGLAAFSLATAVSLADWHRAAELAATGGAKDVIANFRDVRAVQLQWVDGEVDILALWVLGAGQEAEYRVESGLHQGEPIDFELDGRDIMGFRVIDRGNGHYRINVRSGEIHYALDDDEHHNRHRHPRLPPPDRGHAPLPDGDHPGPSDAVQPPGNRYAPPPAPPQRESGAPDRTGKPEAPAKKDTPPPSIQKPKPKPAPKKTPPKSAPKAPSRSTPPRP